MVTILLPMNQFHAGFLWLIIISLVMQSGPGDCDSFSLANALVSYSNEIGESITGGISSCSPMVIGCDRVSLCCYLYITRLLVSISK